MPATQYFEDLLLRYALFQQPFVISNWWISAHSDTSPTSANELWQRQLITWDNLYTNSADIAFPVATSGVFAMSVSLWDLISGGSMLCWGVITSTEVVSGQQLMIPAGTVTLDVLNS